MPDHRRYQDQHGDWNSERGRNQRQPDWQQQDDWRRRSEQPYEHGEEHGPRERLVSGDYIGGSQGQQSDRDIAGGQRHHGSEPGYGRGHGYAQNPYGQHDDEWGGYRQEGGWQRGRGPNVSDRMGYGRADRHERQGQQGGGWYGQGRGQPGQHQGGWWGSNPFAEPFGGQQYAGQHFGGRQESAGGRMSGSSSDPWSSTSHGEHRGRGPKNYTRSDERIREDVCDRLCDDPTIDASDIEVKVAGGEVTLTGQVASRDERRRAEDCAEAISGIKHVQNNLRVKSAGPQAGAQSGSPAGSTSPASGTSGAGVKAGTQH